MLKTFAETQVEEGRQAHMREMEIVNRRVAELEEQQKQTVRAWEGRLAEANGRRTAEVAERDRALLESEEQLRLELAEARLGLGLGLGLALTLTLALTLALILTLTLTPTLIYPG